MSNEIEVLEVPWWKTQKDERDLRCAETKSNRPFVDNGSTRVSPIISMRNKFSGLMYEHGKKKGQPRKWKLIQKALK